MNPNRPNLDADEKELGRALKALNQEPFSADKATEERVWSVIKSADRERTTSPSTSQNSRTKQTNVSAPSPSSGRIRTGTWIAAAVSLATAACVVLFMGGPRNTEKPDVVSSKIDLQQDGRERFNRSAPAPSSGPQKKPLSVVMHEEKSVDEIGTIAGIGFKSTYSSATLPSLETPIRIKEKPSSTNVPMQENSAQTSERIPKVENFPEGIRDIPLGGSSSVGTSNPRRDLHKQANEEDKVEVVPQLTKPPSLNPKSDPESPSFRPAPGGTHHSEVVQLKEEVEALRTNLESSSAPAGRGSTVDAVLENKYGPNTGVKTEKDEITRQKGEAHNPLPSSNPSSGLDHAQIPAFQGKVKPASNESLNGKKTENEILISGFKLPKGDDAKKKTPSLKKGKDPGERTVFEAKRPKRHPPKRFLQVGEEELDDGGREKERSVYVRSKKTLDKKNKAEMERPLAESKGKVRELPGPGLDVPSTPKGDKSTTKGFGYKVVTINGKPYLLNKRSGDLKKIETGKKEKAPHDPYANLKLPKPNVAVLKGGIQDDNNDYQAFLNFLNKTEAPGAIQLDFSERIVIQVTDRQGYPLTNADVRVYDGQRLIHKARTFSDGRTLMHPRVIGASKTTNSFRVEVLPPPDCKPQQKTPAHTFQGRSGTWRIRAPYVRPQTSLKLDIVLCLDCTGSMADEIERIQKTLMSMVAKLNALPNKPQIRWGLVQYRDRGDSYVTKKHGFTKDIEKFQQRLDECEAAGGSDYEESVNEALHKTVEKMDWDRDDAIRLVFLVGDASPHMDYKNDIPYVESMKKAQRRAIKIYPLAASGLRKSGEVIFRQMAHYTMGRFLFISYKENGQASTPHAVSNPGQSNNLDDLIVRSVVDEVNARSQKVPPAPLQPAPEKDENTWD